MKDVNSSTAQGVSRSPPVTDQRLPYNEPKLTLFGDLATLTHAVGNTGNSDGGTQFGMMSSGV